MLGDGRIGNGEVGMSEYKLHGMPVSPDVYRLNNSAPTSPCVEPPHAAIKGARNRVQGESLQSRLDEYHERLVAQGAIAGALRTDAKTVQTGPTTARVIGKGWVDYIVFTKYGRSIHFDAKSTSHPQGYSVPTKAKHQVQRLREMAAGQHVAGFVVEWRHHGVVCWHPIASVFGQRVKFEDGMRLNDVEWMGAI